MEQYLHKCLDSLLVTAHLESLEVLVINDGSKDQTLAIAQEYAYKYPTVFRVINKPNGNYGSCINRGLKEARGKYVKVLDADDSFETEHFENFLAFLTQTDADLIISDFAIIDLQGNIRKIIKYNLGNSIYYEIKDVCTMENFRDGMQMHAVTYRRKCLLDISYWQTEGISYTDQQWIFIPMITVEKVAYYNDYVYKYLVGREGQTMDPAVRLRSIDHTQRCALGMIEFYELHQEAFMEKPISEYLYTRLTSYVKSVYISCFIHYDASMADILSKYDTQIKKTSSGVYKLIGDNSSIAGFRYLDAWRQHQSVNRWAVRCLSRMYMIMLRFRSVLHKENKDMAIPVF